MVCVLVCDHLINCKFEIYTINPGFPHNWRVPQGVCPALSLLSYPWQCWSLFQTLNVSVCFRPICMPYWLTMSAVKVSVLNVHTSRWSEKPAIILPSWLSPEYQRPLIFLQQLCCLKEGTHFQSHLRGIHGVTLRCSHERLKNEK